MSKYRVAVVMPVAHPERCAVHLPMWAERGYAVIVQQDRFVFPLDYVPGIRVFRPQSQPDVYRGWPTAANWLSRWAVREGGIDLVVAAGDDMRPEPNFDAQQMAERYFERFPDGFGIMQPIGDTLDGTDRICGSPFAGKAWVLEAHTGLGLFWPGYKNFYADEELLNVSRKLGVLWQDPQTTHYHDHHTRRGEPMPQTGLDNQRSWQHDKDLFELRRSNGFPQHERLSSRRREQ